MKTILLIRPPEQYLSHRSWPMVSLPLGLLYLGSALEEKGYSAEVIDGSMPQGDTIKTEGENFFGITFKEIKGRISGKDFDIAGISAQYTFQWGNALTMARLCKEVSPSCKVVVGGAHVSVEFDEIIRKYDFIDVAVKGEGEHIMPELVKRIRGSLPLEGLPGVAYRLSDKIVRSERFSIDNLDSLAYPAYHLVDMERYFWLMREYSSRTAYQFPGWERGVSVITSRGCPYNCVFCSIHLHMGKKWRAHSSEYVLKHIDYLVKNYNINYLHFEDDNLSSDPKRFERILDGMLARAWPVRWDTPNGVRIDTFDETILRKCKESGCAFLTFGIESGVQRVLDNVIEKRLSLQKAEGVLRKVKKIGIDSRAFFMLGLPGETKKEIQASLGYALKIMWKYDCFGGFSMAVPLLGTKLYDVCEDKGYFYVEPTLENLASSYLTHGIIRTEEFHPDFLLAMIRRFEKKSTYLLFLIFLRKVLQDFSLLKFLLGNMLRTYPQQWPRLYYKIIFFHHALLYDIRKAQCKAS